MRPVGSKYLLEEPLGRGATGTVWRARQRETAGDEAAVAGHPGEQVAIKVLKEELANDPDVVMRFLRERSVLLRLTADNPTNIVRTRDLVVEGDLIALVMDLIDGPDLHRFLRDNGPLSPVAAALLTAQIVDALAFAHGKGIVHRDLKPANVVLAGAAAAPAAGPGGPEPLRPLLTDFGIARLADTPGVTRAHEFVGSPSYVAPESAAGQAQTSAVDIYSAGVLLYEVLTGHPPFSGGSTLEILRCHISEQPSRPPGVPEPLWTVLDCCLRKSPSERPGAAGLARALRTVAAGLDERATGDQRFAAAGVAALLTPDTAPVQVSGAGTTSPGSAEPTRAMPGGSAAVDPAAATSVLPDTGTPGGPDATRAMPPQPGPDGPGAPHPWEEQLRAARDRNEPTQVQRADAPQDPLYRPPQRRPRRPPQRQPRYAAPAPYPQQQSYPQQYNQPYQPPQQYQPPQPPPPQAHPTREPRGSRSRASTPMRIPGLGCLKSCLFMVLICVVIVVLVWNFTPLQDWIAEGKSFWQATQDWFDSTWEWLSTVGEAQ